MRRFLVPALLAPSLLAAPACLEAQHPEEAAVLETIQRLFDAMAARDTAAASALLTPDGQFNAVTVTGDVVRYRATPHAAFAAGLAARDEALLERFWDPIVHVRGPIAQVWTPYDFHIDGAFSHCGIDAFELVRMDGQWRIAGITYTVEPEGCAPSPLGPPR